MSISRNQERPRGPYKKSEVGRILETSKGLPTAEVLRTLFSYDPGTGHLVRRIGRPGKGGRAGTIAGTMSPSGYIKVKVGGSAYPEHRLVWMWHYGYMPEGTIDHINRVRDDNRVENLREATRSCQSRNRAVRHDSETGVTGVTPRRGGWAARISAHAKGVWLILTEDFTEAVAHRYAAEQCLGWRHCDITSSARKYLVKTGILKEVQR